MKIALLIVMGLLTSTQSTLDEEKASEDEVLIIVDDESGDDVTGEPSSSISNEPEDVLTIVDEGDLAPAPLVSTTSTSRTWFTGDISSRAMFDTRFNQSGEDVVEWWNVGRLKLDHRSSSALRAVVEAWVRWGVVGEDVSEDQTFYLFNAADEKWTADVQLREAYVSASLGRFQLKVGQRIFVWGKNEILAAANILNSLDLRFDTVGAFTSTRDAKVPVFAIDVSYWDGDAGIQLVVLPFFTRHRGFVLGRDFALATPGSELEEQLRAVGAVDPTIEDQVQEALVGTSIPDASPLSSTLALRGMLTAGGWDFAATIYNGWEPTPRLYIDSDLQKIMLSGRLQSGDFAGLLVDPELQGSATAVQQKLQLGQEVIRARYRRSWLFALEGQGVVGPFVMRADMGFSPAQTFYTSDLDVLWKPAFTGTLGMEYTYGETWYIALTGHASGMLDPPDNQPMMGFENTSPDGDGPGKRPMAALYGASLGARWTWVDEALEVSFFGIHNVEPGDYVANAQLSWSQFEPHEARLGAVLIGGPEGSTGRRFGRNDFVYLEYRSTW